MVRKRNALEIRTFRISKRSRRNTRVMHAYTDHRTIIIIILLYIYTLRKYRPNKTRKVKKFFTFYYFIHEWCSIFFSKTPVYLYVHYCCNRSFSPKIFASCKIIIKLLLFDIFKQTSSRYRFLLRRDKHYYRFPSSVCNIYSYTYNIIYALREYTTNQ